MRFLRIVASLNHERFHTPSLLLSVESIIGIVGIENNVWLNCMAIENGKGNRGSATYSTTGIIQKHTPLTLPHTLRHSPSIPFRIRFEQL